MIRLQVSLVQVSLLAAGLALSVQALADEPSQVKPAVELQMINRVRGSGWLNFVNKQVTVKGYFYNRTIPMVLDDYEWVLVDMMIPEESYIPIVGAVPPQAKSGDTISITGILTRPLSSDPAWARKERLVFKLKEPGQIRVLAKMKFLPRAAAYRLTRPAFKAHRPPLIKDLPLRYAVLIAGGGNEANNHPRYWNDLKAMYDILLANGYWEENITVVYADGNQEDDAMPVNFRASKANIASVFDELAREIDDNDSLYIMLNDHGGGFLSRKIMTKDGEREPGLYGGVIDANGDEEDNISEETFNLDLNGDGDKKDTVSVDERLTLWEERMTDDEFAAEVNKIRRYTEIVIQMKQCYSGGFVRDLTGPRRTVMSSCSETEPSWSRRDEGHGEFTYWYCSAFLGRELENEKSEVDADGDDDGYVTVLEAYNCARARVPPRETPFFEDDGRSPGHSGNMPRGGDGNREARAIVAQSKNDKK